MRKNLPFELCVASLISYIFSKLKKSLLKDIQDIQMTKFSHSHISKFCSINYCQCKENGLCRAQSNLLFCCIHKLKLWRTDTCFWAQNRLSLLCTKMHSVKIFSSDIVFLPFWCFVKQRYKHLIIWCHSLAFYLFQESNWTQRFLTQDI